MSSSVNVYSSSDESNSFSSSLEFCASISFNVVNLPAKKSVSPSSAVWINSLFAQTRYIGDVTGPRISAIYRWDLYRDTLPITERSSVTTKPSISAITDGFSADVIRIYLSVMEETSPS